MGCFYELSEQLVIHPEECIDCQACVTECPVEAIFAEADVPDEFRPSIEFNARKARRVKAEGLEAILKTKAPLGTAEEKRAALGY